MAIGGAGGQRLLVEIWQPLSGRRGGCAGSSSRLGAAVWLLESAQWVDCAGGGTRSEIAVWLWTAEPESGSEFLLSAQLNCRLTKAGRLALDWTAIEKLVEEDGVCKYLLALSSTLDTFEAASVLVLVSAVGVGQL